MSQNKISIHIKIVLTSKMSQKEIPPFMTLISGNKHFVRKLAVKSDCPENWSGFWYLQRFFRPLEEFFVGCHAVDIIVGAYG